MSKNLTSVASTRFTWDRTLIRLQTWIFLESASTKLYENAYFTRRCGKSIKQKDEISKKSKQCTDREFVESFSSSPTFCAVVGDRPHFLKSLESTRVLQIFFFFFFFK